MVITRKTLRRLLADLTELEALFPEPDENARVEDQIGCFEHLFPPGKSGVQLIRENRASLFGVEEPDCESDD